MIRYPIVELFQSLQGEGYNTGMPALFLRFGRCNLACQWCDTDFSTYQMWSVERIIRELENYAIKNIILTGGEPTLQTKLPFLLAQLKQRGYFIAIETNGLRKVDPLIDYITISPKFAYRHKYNNLVQSQSDEVRIVVEEHCDFYHFCLSIEKKISAAHYFLSPCEQNGQFNLLPTLRLLGQLNQNRQMDKWLISMQTHKLADIQ